MPHQCTDCGTVFEDGSTEMLSGCPDCGGNTFQFLPDGTSVGSAEADARTDTEADSRGEPSGSPSEPEPTTGPSVEPPDRPSPGNSVASTVGSAAATVRKFVGGDAEVGTSPEAADPLSPWKDDLDETRDDRSSAPEHSPSVGRNSEAGSRGEDDAQASARSAVVSPDELPDSGAAELAVGSSSPGVSAESTADTEAERDRPGLEELREELNDQFESIRIVEPGQYELNLMELYEREEYIIALQEDGRYRIQVPETWQG